MQKPCRHLASISLGKLSTRLSCNESPALNVSSCASCSKPAESPIYACLTCLQCHCHPSHLIHHSHNRNHPLSFNLNSLKGEASTSTCIESDFYCALCSNQPKINEPGKKERVALEKVKGFFLENQKKAKGQKLRNEQIIDDNDKRTTFENKFTENGPKGIVNLGNTCFMNSALQVLAATLKRHGPLKTCSSSAIWNSLIHHLEEIYSSTSTPDKKKKTPKNSNNNCVNPREFLGLLSGKQKKFASMQQQDAHDFLRLLFNSVPDAPQIELFGGKFISRVVCERCKSVSDTIEPFLDISLALPDESESETTLCSPFSKLKLADTEYYDDLSNSHDSHVSLNELIKNWNKKIFLQGENGYYCETCNPQDPQTLQTASLQFFLIDPLPPFLILHLQRFKTQIAKSSSGRKGKGGGGAYCLSIEKDDRSISFPLNLTVSSQSQETDTNYRLYGYIIHEGASTSSGHYTAVVSSNDSWFYASDTRVKEISNSRALDHESFSPYLLFYQKYVNE